VFPDSPGYFSEPPKLEGYFSLTGNSLRAWPSVLLFWVFDSNFQRTFIQSLLYAASWSLLLLAFTNDKSVKYKLFTSIPLILFAISPLALQWNMMLLAESLSISLIVFSIAAIRFAISFKKKDGIKILKLNLYWLLSGTLTLSIAAVNRPSLLPMLIIPIYLWFISVKQKLHTLNWNLFGALVLLACLIYPITYNTTTNNYWSNENGRVSRTSLNFILNTAKDGPAPNWANAQWDYVIKKAPKCITEGPYYLRASAIPGDPMGAWYVADLITYYCPEGTLWLNQNFTYEYLNFIFDNPKPAVVYFSKLGTQIAEPTGYVFNSILPKWLDGLFQNSSLKRGISPVIIWLGASAIAFLIISLRSKWRQINEQFAFLIFLGGALSISLTLLMISTESTRIAIPATTALYIGTILMVAEVFTRKSSKLNF
jgi:hypothetical protein